MRRTIRRKADRLTRQLWSNGISAEDLEQEFDLHLWQLSGRYSIPAEEARRFLRRILDRKGVSLLRHHLSRRRRHRDPEGLPRPFDNLNPDLIPEHRRNAQRLTELRLDVAEVLAKLSPPLRALCVALQQSTITEVARQRGVGRAAIYRELKELLRALQSLEWDFGP